MNCCSISFSLILLFSLASRADTTNAPAPAALPTPVPGIPVGWCIRAKTPVFADAKAAGFEYVELALQDVYGLSDPDFSRLVADLQRLGLNARSGYNPIPKELKIVGPDVERPNSMPTWRACSTAPPLSNSRTSSLTAALPGACRRASRRTGHSPSSRIFPVTSPNSQPAAALPS